jgi:hypothetical protein
MTQEECSRLIFRGTHLGALLATLLGVAPLVAGLWVVHFAYADAAWELEIAVYLSLVVLGAGSSAYPPGR